MIDSDVNDGDMRTLAGLSCPACLVLPRVSSGGELEDLEFLAGNAAMSSRFSNFPMLKSGKLLSAYDLPYWDRLLAVCRKTWEQNIAQSIEIFIETRMERFILAVSRSADSRLLLELQPSALSANPSDQPKSALVSLVRLEPGAEVAAVFSAFVDRFGNEMPYLEELFTGLMPRGRIENYDAGDFFVNLGEHSGAIGFILSGGFRQYAVTASGEEYTIAFFRPAQIINSSPVSNGLDSNTSFAIEARTESRMFIVDAKVLISFAQADLRWHRLFFHNILIELQSSQERVLSLLCEGATERYKRFLLENRDFLPFIRSYHLASYLGITSETLSRVRKSLSEKGE